MNFYEHHIGDYAEATAHLTFLEDAAYSRLIRKYYATERPLPADVKAVQRLVGAREKVEREAVVAILDEFFELREDGWHNARCDAEIAKFHAGEPDREARRNHEESRLRRHREERARLFTELRAVGIEPNWNVPISELKRLHRDHCNAPATAPETFQAFQVSETCNASATAPATPATATHTPLPTSHFPLPSPQYPIPNPEYPSAAAPPGKAVVPRETSPDWFADFKLAYPDRAGDQGWRRALRAGNARLAEGHTAAELIAGARRYAAFVDATGKRATEFVKQAATFLGPEKPFLLPWHPPPRPETDTERLLRLNRPKSDDRVIEHEPEPFAFLANR